MTLHMEFTAGLLALPRAQLALHHSAKEGLA